MSQTQGEPEENVPTAGPAQNEKEVRSKSIHLALSITAVLTSHAPGLSQ